MLFFSYFVEWFLLFAGSNLNLYGWYSGLPCHTLCDSGLQWRNRSGMINNDVTGFPIYFLPVLRASLEVTRTTEVMRDSWCLDTARIDCNHNGGQNMHCVELNTRSASRQMVLLSTR